MTTTTNVSRADSDRTLSMILKRQSKLYDLHTHLMGMGNASFWIDTVLMDENIMPTNTTFAGNEKKRYELCPLIWDQTSDTGGFVEGKKAADFFRYLVNDIIQPKEEQNFDNFIKQINDKNFSPVLAQLIQQDFYDELVDRNLTFKEYFSYDVVLTLSDLSKGLGIKQTNCDDIKQVIVTEKLGVYPPAKVNFRDWIIFNAREQKFQIVYGIRVEELRSLIECNPNAPSKAQELARANIINAFSMCDAQGTPARHVDLHGFHGSFTPEFYPRRFALKDSIYSQRPDILAMLIAHIIDRYQTCLPPIKYCEFSISVNDLSRPWMFDVIRSVRVYDSKINTKNYTYLPTAELSSFAQFVLNGSFPHLEFAFTGPESDSTDQCDAKMSPFTYKFLAGFDRRKVKSSKFSDVNEALQFLLEYPQQAILLMIREIVDSKRAAVNPATNKEDIFSDFVAKLNDLESKASKMPAFYDWVVGLDLFGDELGYPYCPFVARPFIKYIQERRRIARETGSKNIFGVRIHCGENVTFADDSTQAYRLFVAHMYIVFRSLRFLQQELEYGIRIGHGIAFDRIFGENMIKLRHRKSSVLLAEVREHAKHLMKTIAFEVNITSNEYLLGQTLRQGDDRQPLRLDGLFGKIPIILATDDDGVWPIDQCAFTHPGHQSLTAEYCRAISSGLIKNVDQLKTVLQDTKNFCFWNTGGDIPKPLNEDALPTDDLLLNTVIIHPDIIRRLLKLYDEKQIKVNSCFKTFAINTKSIDAVDWSNEYGALRIAFICVCANHDKTDIKKDKDTKSKIHQEYNILFGENESQFNSIYDFWREVRSELILSDAQVESSQTQTIGSHVLLNSEGTKSDVVYFARRQNSSMQSQQQSLPEFIHQFRFLAYTIHAYGDNVNIEKIVKLLKQKVDNAGSEKAYKDMTLYLYTNTNIYTYVRHKLGESFYLKVNPHPSKRDKKKESFLYVLCPCASAATSALHLICDRISPNAPENDFGVAIGVAPVETIKEGAPKEISVNDLPIQNNDSIDEEMVKLGDKMVENKNCLALIADH